MKLHSAEFDFGTHKVAFIGALIVVYEDAGVGSWDVIGEKENKWTNRGSREDDGVMGRAFKPRLQDAADILAVAKKKRLHELPIR